MGVVSSLFLIMLGLLVIYPVLKAQKSAAVDVVESIQPYQKGLGAFAAVVGAICLILDLVHINELFHAPLFWMAKVAGDLLLVGLGGLLGYEVLQKNLLQKNAELEGKAQDVLAKLQQRKTQLGYVGIGFGFVALILSVFR